MLDVPPYEYSTNKSHLDYEFRSIGSKGVIKKIARFDKIEKNIFSFGFGDLNDITGEISDSIATNNGDAGKVLGTVAHIIYDFTSLFPGAVIFIQGSNSARTRLYQMNINHHLAKLKSVFSVFGYRNGEWEPFQKGKNYDAFMARRYDYKLKMSLK